jgi:hypothetical protein
MDTATVIAALEWAIRFVRSGHAPDNRRPIRVHRITPDRHRIAEDSDSAGEPALSGRR